MKLKSLSIAMAICAMMLASCGNSAKSDSGTVNAIETTETISQVEDNSCDSNQICNDSIVIRGKTTTEGFGRCSKCNCKEFEGRGQTCRNCGHSYKAHY